MANSAIVGVLRALLMADTAQFDAAMKRSSDSARVWSRDLRQIGQQATQVGAALTKSVTLPIVALAGASVKAAMDFEQSFANVRKTVDGTEPQLDAFAKTIRQMAKEIPATTDELNEIAALGGQMGVPIEQLEKFTRNVSALGVAVDGISTEEAAAGLAQIGNATGQGTVNIDKMASSLVHLGNNSAATEADILEFTKRLAGAGHTVGMTVPEIMSLGTAMANVGINAEAGGTAMSTVIAKMSSAVSQGGEALKEFARIAGRSSEEFAEIWRRKPIEAMDLFIKGLARVRSEGGDLNLTMGELGTEGIRVADTLKRLSGATETVADITKVANEGWESGRKHIEEAEKKYKTFTNQLKLLWAQLKDVGITLGDAMMPALRSLVELGKLAVPILEQMAKVFAALPGPIQLAVLGVAALAAAAGPLLFITGQLITATGTVVGAFTAKGIATKALAVAQGTLTGTTAGLTGAMRALALAAGAAAAVLGGALLGAMVAIGREASNEAIRKSAEDLAKADELIVKKQEELNRVTAKGNDLQAQKLRQELELLKQGRERGVQMRDQADVERDLAIEASLLEQANRNLSDSNTTTTTTTSKLTDEQKKAAKAVSDLADEMGGAKLRGDVLELNAAIAKLNAEQKKNPEVVERMLAKIKPLVAAGGLPLLSDEAHKLYIEHVAMHDILPKIGTDWDALLPKSRNFTMEIKEQSRSLAELLAANQLMRGLINRGPADLSGSFAATGIQPSKPPSRGASFGQELIREFQGFASQLGPTILSALTGGGNVLKSIGALAGTFLGQTFSNNFGAVLKSTLGSALGGALNAMLPGIGALLGPLLGKIGAAFKTLGRNVARDMQDAFATQELGFAHLNALLDKLKTMGPEGARLASALDRAQRRDDEGATKRAIEDVRKFLQAAEEDARQLGEALDDAFSRATDAAQDFGGKVPAALRPFLDELRNAKGLTEDQKAALDGLAGAPSWQTLQSIAEGLGIDLAALGPSFTQAKIDDTAMGYARSLITLRDAGADMNGVLAGSKDELQGLADQALKTGSSLPKAIEPFLQALVDSGELLDENGNKLENLDRFTFTGTLEDAFKDMKSILEEIRDLLAKGLPNAAKEGAQGVRDQYKDGIDVPVRWSFGDLPRFEFEGPELASGGIVTSPRLVGIGEGGPEAVIPLSRLPEMVSGVRGDASTMFEVHLHNYLDGRRVSEVLIPHLKPSAKRVGVRPI